MFFLKVLESSWSFLHHHSIFSAVRLFKLSMLAALVLVRLVRPRLNAPLRTDWFYRFSGICLDLLTLGSLAALEWRTPLVALREGGGRGASLLGSFEATVVALLGWNLYAVRQAPELFPNFPFARATVLVGDSLGHSWVGLLLARSYDPFLQTPVPLAFTAKMLLSIPVPGSAVKNQLVLSSIETIGLLPTLLMCCIVLASWVKIHTRYFKPLWPKHRGPPRGGCSSSSTAMDVAAAAVAATAVAARRGGGYGNDFIGRLWWVGGWTSKRKHSKDFTLSSGASGGEGGDDGGDLDEEEATTRRLLEDRDGGGKTLSSSLMEPSSPDHPSSLSSSSSSSVADGQKKDDVLDDAPPPCEMSEPSGIMNNRMVAALIHAMPSPLLKERAWNCVYSLDRDGACCATLMDSCRHHATYLLTVEDSWGYVFGASWSHALSDAHGGAYYGTGESWLFSFHNLAPEQLVT
jgi:hypothetical protein